MISKYARWTALLSLTVAGTVGCGPVQITGGDAAPPTEDDLMEIVADGSYRPWGFEPAALGVSSDLGPMLIDLWVSEEAVSDFLQIRPSIEGSGVELPPGSVILRDVIEFGVRTKVTIMAKQQAGYFPEGGDFWYGVASVNGEILSDDTGPLRGRLAQCGGCHAQRAQDGYLFGIPGT
jgi:hypothetical protein